jgi:CDP-diglyceride synthetase
VCGLCTGVNSVLKKHSPSKNISIVIGDAVIVVYGMGVIAVIRTFHSHRPYDLTKEKYSLISAQNIFVLNVGRNFLKDEW